VTIRLKRIQLPPSKQDGIRILAERLWPRGVSKERAGIDFWMKDIAPSADLREWFQINPKQWLQFKKRYWSELAKNETLAAFRHHLKDIRLTIVFAAKDDQHNSAVALKEYLSRRKPLA
jgi:uncharacterized protein YeaO (DUF488 family)